MPEGELSEKENQERLQHCKNMVCELTQEADEIEFSSWRDLFVMDGEPGGKPVAGNMYTIIRLKKKSKDSRVL